jgi:tRNA-specific 2-thiouridylase
MKFERELILYVAFGDDPKWLYSDKCIISSINLISDERPLNCSAKFRYRSKDVNVELEYLDDKIIVKYKGKAKGVTPGQACVLYNGEECIGSGIIDDIYLNDEKLWYI